MRDYTNIDKYLDELSQDIYPQPVDDGHFAWANEFIEFINNEICLSGRKVLDLGCGVAFVAPLFKQYGALYSGVTLHEEDIKLSDHRYLISLQDFHMLNVDLDWFDVVFSRHSLEHSPMPLLALMEWYRVSTKYLCLVVPNPDHFPWTARNHYSVMNIEQLTFLLRRAGWVVVKEQEAVEEIRLICKKVKRSSTFYAGVEEI